MKIINHKDGSRSFKFSQDELVHGSQAESKALAAMARSNGGVYTKDWRNRPLR